MSQTWSPFDTEILPQRPDAGLETPAVLLLSTGGEGSEDTVHSSARFSLPPLRYSTRDDEQSAQLADAQTQQSPPDPDPEALRRLGSLRKSPGFRLLAGSVLLLKVWQLDMDLPARKRHFVRQRLADLLEQRVGLSVDPDSLHLTFTTEVFPATDDEGAERYTRKLSLTEVALAIDDPASFMGLSGATLVEGPVAARHPLLQAPALFSLIRETAWPDDYRKALDTFWGRQRQTYRTLCRLSFLDGLSRQRARGRISNAAYSLTLDALGLSEFPVTVAALERAGRGQKTQVWGLMLDGEYVPGIFQVRSHNTSHCFIHVVGAQRKMVEYISSDPAEMTRRLVEAMNVSGWHRQMLHMLELADHAASAVRASVIEGDVFTTLTEAQERLTYKLHHDEQFHRLDLLKPLARALALASAAEFWPTHYPVLDLLPEPSKSAAQLMRDFLHNNCGLALDPDHVFVAYRRGSTLTPLGNPRVPATHVNVPDERPVNLSQALMTHYQVQCPAGYIDHGGRTVVFLDRSAKGIWAADRELPIEPQAVEDYIRDVNFLTTMTGRITDFWELRRDAIEDSFASIFIGQALLCLKQGRLTRSGFQLVINALDRHETASWRALGFHVQDSTVDSMVAVYPGLLVAGHPGKLQVLYQAGHAHAFRTFRSELELDLYLRHAAADPHWRESVAHYVADRHRPRLDYVLKLWGGIQSPDPPASLLRPWTDVIYNHDTRKALQHSLMMRMLDDSPFGFLRLTLKQNALEDAQDQIVTATEVSLRYWTSQLTRLQLLLVPMSVLLTPAFLASLATEIGVTSLSIASAHLPGSRHEEKTQALLGALSLGLLRLGPQTPRLLRALGRVFKPGGDGLRTGRVAVHATRGAGSVFRRSLNPRRTRLEKFFHTDAMLKRWTVAGHPQFGTLPVHAWKLGRRFLLWTSDKGQARTLVVSTHGHYMPWTSTVKIPHGTEIQTYAPHGYMLVDPSLHSIVNRTVQPFAVSNAAGNTLVQTHTALPPLLSTDRFMAGTSLPGRLKNYSLSKFQSVRGETYEDIAHIVRNSNASPLRGQLPAGPMDVLTVRNRFGMPSPALADLFDSLYAQGIHYDRILLVHCRCAAIAALFRRAPVYQAPTLQPSIANLTDLAGQLEDTRSDDLTHRS